MRSFQLVGLPLVVSVSLLVLLAGCTESDSPSDVRGVSADELQMMDAFEAGLNSKMEEIAERTEQLFDRIEAGEAEEIYRSMCTPRFCEAASLEKFQSLCERIQSSLGPLKRIQSPQFNLTGSLGHPVASALDDATFLEGSGHILVVYEKSEEEWLLLRLNVNAPELLDDPSRFREPVELLAENSEPVLPGQMVDVLDGSTDPPTVIAENVQVIKARWKVSSPLEEPKYPAEGFVTVPLTNEEFRKVHGIAVTVRKTKQQEEESRNR